MANSVMEELLSIMECPICFNLLSPPIKQCIYGHSICGFCSTRIKNCPLCREAMLPDHRCLLLEAIYDKLVVPCPNGGCSFESGDTKMQHHLKSCIYRLCECPKKPEGCRWTGPLTLLTKHYIENH